MNKNVDIKKVGRLKDKVEKLEGETIKAQERISLKDYPKTVILYFLEWKNP